MIADQKRLVALRLRVLITTKSDSGETQIIITAIAQAIIAKKTDPWNRYTTKE